MLFDLADLRRSFGATILAQGRDYFERLRVVEMHVGRDRIEAHVAGSNQNRYAVTLRVNERNGARSIVGTCTCPVQLNCKHAAAAAFSALARSTSGPKRDAADGAVDSWVEAMAAKHAHAPRESAREHVRYAIDVQERYYVPRFELKAYVAPRPKSGAHAALRSLDLHSLATSNAKHVMTIDRTIGRLVGASGLLGGLGNVSPTILGTLLELLIGTGRLYWRAVKESPLHREAISDARLAWRLDDDGRQRIRVDGRPQTILISSSPLWYVDTEKMSAGPVDTGIDPEIASVLAAAPALTEEQARRANVSLRRVFTAAGVEPPKAAIDERIIDDDPTPLLRLSADVAPPNAVLDASERFATAELQFAYGEHVVRPNDRVSEFRIVADGVASSWARQGAFERRSLERLQALGFTTLGIPHGNFVERERSLLRLAGAGDWSWIRFLGTVVPELRKDGWAVDIDESFPYTIVDAEDEWHADLTEREAHWFEFDLGIDIEGQRIPLLPILIDAIAVNGIDSAESLAAIADRHEPIFGRLPNGTYVALPAARVARVLATLVNLFDGADALNGEGRVLMTPLQAAAAADLADVLRLRWIGGAVLRDLLAALSSVDGRAARLPATLKAELRPYQRDGVAWLQLLREHGFGGVLADDMGLGKTVQLLAHIAIEKDAGRLRAPVLIIAPTSVVPNWRAEIARFVPELRVLSLTGADRDTRFAQIDDADIVLSTYALLPRDAEHLLERDWSIAVLDEAQAVKNPRAKAAVAATQLRAEQRIALTGTPIENHLGELWSIYSFAVPGLLGERARFARLFRTPIERRNDVLRRSALAARLRPFLLRRTKEHVALELPAKTEIVQRVELAGAQRDLYETIRLAMHKRVRDEVTRRGLARSRIVVLDALLKLRQVCCDPRLLKLAAANGVKESQKLDALLDMLESLIEDGRRVLLFSQFTSMLDLMKPELTKRHLSFVELRGDTRDRETPVQRFQRGEVPLFLISLKAGGTGINLTAADTVIHYDPWWNPAVERQATDRAHRIGQEQHVFVYKLIAEGTVEERILELQERKGALAAGLFQEASTAPLRLEFDDIERLFA